jgi:hypothetical protein
MAHIMAPATESIMGSLPRAKAGVGSAMNDTTRQVGGAVGVAVLGSILASRYSASVTASLRGVVPDQLVARARDSVGTALGVVRDVPSARPYAPQIVEAAHSGFLIGLHTAVLVAGVIMLFGAAGVWRWLPARAHDDERDVALAAAPAAGGAGAAADGAAEIVPAGIGPVDVVPAGPAVDVAEELEVVRHGAVDR